MTHLSRLVNFLRAYFRPDLVSRLHGGTKRPFEVVPSELKAGLNLIDTELASH